MQHHKRCFHTSMRPPRDGAPNTVTLESPIVGLSGLDFCSRPIPVASWNLTQPPTNTSCKLATGVARNAQANKLNKTTEHGLSSAL